MAIKVANTVVINDTRDITFTTNQTLSRAANAQVSDTASLTGSGYSVCGNKALTLTGKGFSNTVFDNSTCLVMQNPLTPQQGITFGYAVGETGTQTNAPPNVTKHKIDKFPFASDTNASLVGNLATESATRSSGASSSTHGYVTGGERYPHPNQPLVRTTDIQKFPFTSDTNATDVGEITTQTTVTQGYASPSDGYVVKGCNDVALGIEKYPFSSDTNSTEVTEVACNRGTIISNSSTEAGFVNGQTTETFFKVPFASDTSVGDIGDVIFANGLGTGLNSDINGYIAGNSTSPSGTCQIQKFPFASESFTTTPVGFIASGCGGAIYNGAGSSSTTNGYLSGGTRLFTPTPGDSDDIDKFPFASDTNSADVGNLTGGIVQGSGYQV